jgi:biotin carboxyl carrier protein
MDWSLGAASALKRFPMRYITTIGEHEYLVEILDDDHVIIDGNKFKVDFASIGDQPVFSLLLNEKSYEAFVYPIDKSWQVLFQGRSYDAFVEEEMEKQFRLVSSSSVSEAAEYHLKAPMPGLVVAVSVDDGQTVQKGDLLVILESMKMQNELKAPRAGQVTRLKVKSGDRVEQQQIILTLV